MRYLIVLILMLAPCFPVGATTNAEADAFSAEIESQKNEPGKLHYEWKENGL